MNIVKLYKTSRGVFTSFEEASKKKNCSKYTDPRYTMQREIPMEVFAILHEDKYFELNELQVCLTN